MKTNPVTVAIPYEKCECDGHLSHLIVFNSNLETSVIENGLPPENILLRYPDDSGVILDCHHQDQRAVPDGIEVLGWRYQNEYLRVFLTLANK